MATNQKKDSATDGGYYAIKGFVFQFDKTILEVLANPKTVINIEQIQDIETESYYLQVKHKETQEYAPSKIRKAVIQLLEESKLNQSKNFTLYCYFKDKSASTLVLSLAELDKILGVEKTKHSTRDKRQFVKLFSLEFAEDFEAQFKLVLSEIKKAFNLKTDEEAVLHHTNFRGLILNTAIQKTRTTRIISLDLLKQALDINEKIVFEIAYSKHLTNAKYLAYLKKHYFTHKKINIKNSERLFVVDVDKLVTNADLIKIIIALSNKYYVKDASGAPYILLSGITDARYLDIKRKLWDSELFFTDGTHFHGDTFRIDSLISQVHKIPNNQIRYKLLSDSTIQDVIKKHEYDEVFIFADPLNEGDFIAGPSSKKFYLTQTKDILKVIE